MRFRIKILKQVKRTLDRQCFSRVKKVPVFFTTIYFSIGTSSLIIWSFLNSNFFFVHFCVLKMGGGIHSSRFIMNYTTASHTFFFSATAFVARRCYVSHMNVHYNSISRDRNLAFKFFQISKNPFFGVLKLCETL